MRGFFLGSFALIVLYVIVQEGTAEKIGIGSNALVSLIRRAMSPGIAGIPNLSGFKIQSPTTTGPGITVVPVGTTYYQSAVRT